MLFVYHADLVEQVVFLVTRTNPTRECELHEKVDLLYAISDVETRSAAFCKAYGDHFTAWKLADGFESHLRTLIGDCNLHRCAMVPASRGRNQKVDLLTKTEAGFTDRTLFIQVLPESILDPTPLLPWLQRELLQVADMLDERFGYRPDDIVGSPWERKLRQDRYMVLWRIHVAGRLLRAGMQNARELASLHAAFEKAFRNKGNCPAPESFDRVLHAEALTHAQLLAWAIEPRELQSKHSGICEVGPGPGGLCPLCGFPTHDWFDFESRCVDGCFTTIQAARPGWQRDQGACRQCMETYIHRIGGNGVPKNWVGGEDDVRALQEELAAGH